MPGDGIESQIKQIEKYIEKKRDSLEPEDFRRYSTQKQLFKQYENSPQCIEEYYGFLVEVNGVVKGTSNHRRISKHKKNLVKKKQLGEEISNELATMSEDIKLLRKIMPQCSDLLKRENTMNKMYLLLSIFATVFITALICYAIFSHPNYILDNVTVRENMKGISL